MKKVVCEYCGSELNGYEVLIDDQGSYYCDDSCYLRSCEDYGIIKTVILTDDGEIDKGDENE